jgi:putative spermidine/putrescine transport system permease protein
VKAALVVFAFVFGSYEIPFLLGPTLPKALPILAYIEFQDPNIVNRCYSMALNGVTTLLCTVLAIVYFVILQREKKA